MTRLLQNAYMEMSKRGYRKMELVEYRGSSGIPAYQAQEVPTLQITIPMDDWRHIQHILEVYQRDVDQHPALKDLMNQYHEMRFLLGDNNVKGT